MRSHSSLLALALLALSPSALPQSFTVEQVLGYSFPSGLTPASQVPRVAWLFDARGERNIWVADGPSFTQTAGQVTTLCPLGQSKKAIRPRVSDRTMHCHSWSGQSSGLSFQKTIGAVTTAKWSHRKEEPRLRLSRKDNGLTA